MIKTLSTWERRAQIAVVLLCALALKLYYSAASVNELRWILAPTTKAVELVSGSRFAFESYAGYVSSDRSFVIAASCAGVNFLITGFLMLSLGRLWRARATRVAWRFFPCAAVGAYLTTIVANTVRITTALQLHETPLRLGGLSGNQVHRFEGIFVYFGFLLLLFVLSEMVEVRRLGRWSSNRVAPAGRFNGRAAGLWQKLVFPLVIYYATTLGIPLANALRHGSASTDFREHAAFVLLTPLLLLVPLALVSVASLRK